MIMMVARHSDGDDRMFVSFRQMVLTYTRRTLYGPRASSSSHSSGGSCSRTAACE